MLFSFLAAVITFIVALDTKIIIVATALVSPVVFIILHVLAQRAIDFRRRLDEQERIVNSFEERMERLLLAASKLTYRELDAVESEDIIEDFKIDVYAKYRAVRRYWTKHKRDLKLDKELMSRLDQKIQKFLYEAASRKEWKNHYGRNSEQEKCLLDLCEDIVDQAHDAVE